MADDPGFGLYLHWPWCQAKCPYCDFNSHVSATIDHDVWQRAYLTEIGRWRALTGARRLRSVFFGGGTPSLMPPAMVGAILAAAERAWGFEDGIEITLEGNPTSVEAGRFAGYHAAGVNRVSLGVQALRDQDLRALGRLHTAAEALRALDVARGVFDRVSADLIYARQHQTVADWEAELGEALALGLDHLSLYQLTIEDGTAFGARFKAGKLPGLPDEDLGTDLWDVTQGMTEAAGLPAYEVSNHARAGAESEHNRIYWESGDWAGIGPGAHGRLTLDGGRRAYATQLAPQGWLDGVASGGRDTVEEISREDTLAEFLLMGLRLRDGVSLARLEALGGDSLVNNINMLIVDGLVVRTNDRLQVSDRGRPVLNAVLRQILAV